MHVRQNWRFHRFLALAGRGEHDGGEVARLRRWFISNQEMLERWQRLISEKDQG